MRKFNFKIFYTIICILILNSCTNNNMMNTNNKGIRKEVGTNYLKIGEFETGIYRCYELSDDSIKQLLKDLYNIDVSGYCFKDNYTKKILDQCTIASDSNINSEIDRIANRDTQLILSLCVNLETGKIYFTIDNDVIYKNDEVKDYFFNIVQPFIKSKVSSSGSYVLKRTLRVLDNPIDISVDLYHKISNLKYEDKTYSFKVQNAITEDNELVDIE